MISRWCFIVDLIKTLPYIIGALATVGGGIKWLYGKLEKDRDRYQAKYEEKEKENEELKDQLNQKEIEIIKLKASMKGAFYDERKKK